MAAHCVKIPSQPLTKRPQSELTIGLKDKIDKENTPFYVPPFRWTKRYWKFRKIQKEAKLSGADAISLEQLALPLNNNHAVKTEADALRLIEEAMWKEAQENRHSRKAKTKDWDLVAQELATERPRNYFAPRRWPPPNEAKGSTSVKRKAMQAAVKDLDEKRVRFNVPYEAVEKSAGATMRRLSPEEPEKPPVTREPPPEVGHGKLIPREILEFNNKNDGSQLENAPDPLEHYSPNERGYFWAESSFLEGAIVSRNKKDREDGLFCRNILCPAQSETDENARAI